VALDLKKMKQKLDNLQNRGGGGSNTIRFWKPQEGNNTVRIVCPKDGDAFKGRHLHYNVGKRAFLCPEKNFDEDCPVCDFGRSLYKQGDPESISQAKTMFARQRYYSPVVVRGEESEGVRWWGYGKTVYETLLKLVLNPEYGDITDPETGTDLDVAYDRPPGASFPKTTIVAKRRSSPVCPDMTSEECRELLDSIPDFDALFDTKSSAEITALLNEHLTTEADAEGLSTETEKYASTTKSTVDDAFSELLG